MAKLLQKNHLEKDYFNSVGVQLPPVDPPLSREDECRHQPKSHLTAETASNGTQAPKVAETGLRHSGDNCVPSCPGECWRRLWVRGQPPPAQQHQAQWWGTGRQSTRVTLRKFANDPNQSTSIFFVFSWRRLDAHQLEAAAIHSCMFNVIRREFRGLALMCPCMSAHDWRPNSWVYRIPIIDLLLRH